MAKREAKEVALTIESTVFPGIGVGSSEGRTFHVKGAFPGQTVRGIHAKNKRRIGLLRSFEVIERSKGEKEPSCVHYENCGGCISQELPMERQRQLKEAEVFKLFESAHIPTAGYRGILPAPMQYGYRNKMEYTFGDEVKGGPLCLGMHLKNRKNAVVTVDQCLLVPEDFNRLLDTTLNYFKNKGIPHYRAMAHEGTLRHMILRRGERTGELMAVLVTAKDERLDPMAWAQELLKTPLEGTLSSIFYMRNDSLSDAVVAEELTLLHGRDHILEEVCGLTFAITPMSFFQTNTQGAEQLYDAVADLARDLEQKEVFDLYCGTGTIGTVLAKKGARRVQGVEIVEEAAAIAQENARRNHVTNASFYAGDVKDVLKDLKGAPDLVVVDPPRSGMHAKALDYAMAFGAQEMIYVSCNPKTLVQDLQTILLTMEIKEWMLLDNYPNTPHVETVALLSKLDVDKRIDVKIEMDELDITTAESKATYEEIKEYILEKFKFKVSTLYIAQIKRKCGIDLREHYNKSKKEKQVIPQCTPEKEEAIMSALRHFKML
ncbi:RNA methyltransferase, TrmA family [Clostridiaceae bacterium JG1575]|nr:RNA methyltransferase, TrmA family [Clostridiaceae bacterium JG1575]